MFTNFFVKPGAPQWQWILAVTADFLIFGGVLFLLLRAFPGRYRKPFVMLLTFLAGLIYSTEFFIPPQPGTDVNFMTPFTQTVDEITTVIYAFALGLGVYSLIRFHGASLIRRQKGWHNNLAFFVAFIVLIFVGFWKDVSRSKVASETFNILFQSTIVAPGATMFSIIAFYIVSAAYRAFRIRSAEATLMLAAAFIVMLGQVPIGAALTNFVPLQSPASIFKLENLSYWILKAPNMAAWRSISFGIEVGALAMALRTWLSLERGSFFDKEL